MKCVCKKFPKLGFYNDDGQLKEFHKGVYHTNDDAEIELLKKIPEVSFEGSIDENEEAEEPNNSENINAKRNKGR